MKSALVICSVVVCLAAGLVGISIAQDEGDYGDAPEGALAYPSTGQMGNFPTCVQIGPAGFIYHSPLGWARFVLQPPGFDTEFDGNAGNCPQPPYDMDECFQDLDAGLITPWVYTIQQGVVVPCVPPPGPPLGVICTMANWGPNVDIHVVNNMPVDGYVNVLMDWDKSGSWGGQSQCADQLFAPEHVLVNWLVPIGYNGPLSGLGPPPFLIGPLDGYVWCRFTVSEGMVPPDWNGEEYFEDGETEDYLLEVVLPDTPVEERSWGGIKILYR